jgi:hypothetical protein
MKYPHQIAVRLAAIRRSVHDHAQAEAEGNGQYIYIPLDDLTAKLGCRTVAHCQSVYVTLQPGLEYEDLVTASLLTALRISVSITTPDGENSRDSVMDGLLRNNRWRACLSTSDDAYCLVQLFVSFFDNLQRDSGASTLRSSLTSDARDAIAQWVLPREMPNQMSALETVRLVFGPAWCAVCLPEDATKWDINLLIRKERPPFMPGLLPVHLDHESLPLPVMSL